MKAFLDITQDFNLTTHYNKSKVSLATHLNHFLQRKAAFTEHPDLRISVKKYAYAHKFLVLLVCFILGFTEHAYFSMGISARVFF